MDKFKQDFYELLNKHLIDNNVSIREFHMKLYGKEEINIDQILDIIVELTDTIKEDSK